MSIKKIFEQVFQDGYLTQAMKEEIRQICDNPSELSIEEYMMMDRLLGALIIGEVSGDDDTGGFSLIPSPRQPGPTPGSFDSAELPIVAAVVRSAIP